MSLILKQEPANTIATPPAGKSTLFVNDNSVMSIKSPDGNVTTFPTITGSNTQVFFNDNGAINGNANLTFNKTTATMSVTNLSVTGNLNAGDISVSSIANGTSNVDIVGVSGNVTTSVGGVANVLVVTTTGTNVTGTFSASGNANAGNLGTTGVFATTLSASGNSNVGNLGVAGSVTATTLSGGLVTGAQPNITSTGTLISLAITGNATAGNVYANSGTIGASLLNGTLTTASQPNITSTGTLSSLAVTGNASAGNLNTAGAVVASTLTSNIATGTAPLTVTSTTRVSNLNVAYANVADNINVSAGTGNNFLIFANAATGNIAELTSTGLTANLSNNSITATTFVGALSGAATTAGTVTTAAQPNITSTGTLTSLAVTGNISAGNVSATTFTGALSGAATSATTAGTVTTAAQPNITSLGTLTSVSVSGNANVGNIGATGGVFTTVAGSLTTASQPNITSLGTLTSASISGNANIGNIGTAGLITATGNLGAGNINTGGVVSATGNITGGNLVTAGILSVTGTGVSSIAGNLDMTSNTIINLASPTNPNDAATKQYVDDVAQGLHTHDSCNAATQTTLATISGGTVTYNNGTSGVGATLTTTGSYTTIDGVTLSNGMRVLVKNEANTAHNGIYDRTSSTVLTRSTDFDTPTEMAGGDFTFVNAGTLYDNTGWVMPDPVTTVGTSPVVWVQFSGAGTYTAGTGLTLTGTVFSVNASQSQITSLGTLTSLSISGNANIGNVGAAAGVFTTVAGSLVTASQPNITSLGTLTSLSVSWYCTINSNKYNTCW
jgi:hypothetical protein